MAAAAAAAACRCPDEATLDPDAAGTPLQGPVPLHSSAAQAFPAHQCNPHPSQDDDVFSLFLRRTTCLSTSTDCTTGSFRRLLPDRSGPYVETVKRLVKRFTAPAAGPSPMPPGPSSHPLPGDFLSCDALASELAAH